MGLYTPLPPELIWEGQESFCPQFQEIKIGKLTLEVEPLGFNQARIVRLISTDPADYLSSPYQPGSVLEFAPRSLFYPGNITGKPALI
ncbi:MAG: hypothetical protein PWQ18_1157 [Clostridia bacterium]|nr:hypothetical protein [Clostridia bacterium]